MSRRFSLTQEQRMDIVRRFYEKVRSKYRTDAEFYATYDIAKGTFGNWKKHGKINLALIIQFCSDESVSLDYILRGITPEDIPRKRKSS